MGKEASSTTYSLPERAFFLPAMCYVTLSCLDEDLIWRPSLPNR
jgi:hypothetical protein